jgi:hypothetical protein
MTIFQRSLALYLIAALPVPAAAQLSSPLRAGDIVVMADPEPISGSLDLMKVDPVTGAKTTLSNFDEPTQGPVAPRIFNPSVTVLSSFVSVEDATSVFVVHPAMGTAGRAALVHVDATTGFRTIVSDFGNANQGPLVGSPSPVGRFSGGLAVESSGDFLVLDSLGALVRVNRTTGARVTVSDLRNPAEGPLITDPRATMTVVDSGQIIVGVPDRALFRIDPSNGARTILSDFVDPTQGPSPPGVVALAVDFSGSILILDPAFEIDPFPSPAGRIYRVDPTDGVRSLAIAALTGCGTIPTTGNRARDLALAETGDLFVIAGVSDTGEVLDRVDALTGACRPVGSGSWLSSLTVVRTPLINELVTLSVASTAIEAPFTNAPAGVFRITAALTNTSSMPIRNPFFRVADLSGANILSSGDRPPDLIRAGGPGTRQTPNVGTDGVLSPGESVVVEFAVGLQTRKPFTLFVDVFGEANPADGSR